MTTHDVRPGGSVVGSPTADWRDLAACRGADPNLWFPALGEKADEAKAVCQRCSVRKPCLEYAIATRQEEGIWGGVGRRKRFDMEYERRGDGWLHKNGGARRLVETLTDEGPMTLSELSALTGYSVAYVSRTLQRLKRTGHVKSERLPVSGAPGVPANEWSAA